MVVVPWNEAVRCKVREVSLSQSSAADPDTSVNVAMLGCTKIFVELNESFV